MSSISGSGRSPGVGNGNPGGSDGKKNLPVMLETRVWSLGWKDPLEKGMAIHTSILGASQVSQTVKNLPAMRVLPAESSWRLGLIPESGKSPGGGYGYPTPIFLPGEFQRRLASYSSWGFEEPNMTEQLNTLTYFLLLWSHRNHFSDEEEKVWRLGEGEEHEISNS